jgi:mono/diheme cytochrome c family protein
MKKLRLAYAILSVVFLGVLAVSPLKNYFREWRAVQQEYNEVIRELPQRVQPISIGLQQIWARDLDRIDRCTSCHLGISDSKLAEAPQPFTTHPKIFHDTDKFGCTICHGGQGLATEYEEAHQPTEFWDKPVLPKKYLQASCGSCHINEALAETPVLNRGRELVEELSCVACHDLAGFEKAWTLALNGIGTKVNRDWLVRWLKNPQAERPATKMPNFMLSGDEVEVLADFLMSFKNFENNARLAPLPKVFDEKKDTDAFINLGKTRFREARCISCHAVEGRGGKLAPDLAKTASKTSAVWLYNYIRNPKRLQPGVEMPQHGFTEEEAAAVVAYMASEFIDWDLPEEDSTAEHTPAPNFFEQGLAVFNKYNCGGCHALGTDKVAENKGPGLTAIGSKEIFLIDFAGTDIPHTRHDFIDAKLESPRAFGENMRMPRYTLSDEDRDAITTALLAQKSEPLPRKFVRDRPERPDFTPQGEIGKILNKYACLKCHTINGTGGKIAPDLSIVGSQLQREWMKDYFKIPYSLRPIVEERMPNLFIAEDEVEKLLDYFETVLIDDSISIASDFARTPEMAERGKGLYFEKYGCQSCHIIDGKGGYVGAPLDRSGERLQPGWAFKWLMHPQKYKPETVEPRSGMSEAEARDIVAYLMTLVSK